jgi:hypothetical protein
VSGSWLPSGRIGAVCLSVDDVHPGRSNGHFEAGGDLSAGVLGRLEWLLDRHAALKITLFTTPDWRELSAVPTRRRLARLPGSRFLPLAPRLPAGAMRLDRHPSFVDYLRGSQFELAVHGLHHFANGPRPPCEFEALGVARARRRLRRALRLFEQAGLRVQRGFCPPGWTLTRSLVRALVSEDYAWVSSARDVRTVVETGAKTAMSGLRGVDLIAPERIAAGRLVHLPVNIQGTLDEARAVSILERGGLVSIKAHAVKEAFGHISPDGLDDDHVKALHALLGRLEDRYGDQIWWASMDEIAARS